MAEGIEQAEQLERLRRLGCEFGQGFLFSPPVDAAGIEAFMAARPAADARRAPVHAARRGGTGTRVTGPV